jgi:hypothetical protein
MPRRPVSVTLDEENLLWLRGQARVAQGNLSQILDRLVTQARASGRPAIAGTDTVVGLASIADDDPDLLRADQAIRRLFVQTRKGWSRRSVSGRRSRRAPGRG